MDTLQNASSNALLVIKLNRFMQIIMSFALISEIKNCKTNEIIKLALGFLKVIMIFYVLSHDIYRALFKNNKIIQESVRE